MERLRRRPGVVRALKAARAWGARPVEFLRDWSVRDKALALALEDFEATTTAHGNPVSVAFDEERGSFLEVKEVVDWEAAALEEYQSEHKNPPPGMRYRVVDTYDERVNQDDC